MLEVIIYTFAFGSICTSFLALYHHPKWWYRIFEVLQPYLAVTALLFIVGLLLLADWNILKFFVLGLLLFNLAKHLQVVLPYTRLFKPEIEEHPEAIPDISVLVINVLLRNQNTQALKELVEREQPDLLLLVEYTAYWHNQTPQLLTDYPYQVVKTMENGFGIALFSKIPLINPTIEYLVDPKVPSIHAEAKITKQGRTINFIGTHPSPPVPWERGNTKQKDLEIFKISSIVQENKHPTIVAGDFNDANWSIALLTFKNASKLFDPRRGRGFYNTFHATNPLINYPIDHIYVSQHFLLTEFKRVKLKGSDHFGLIAGLKLKEGELVGASSDSESGE